MRFYRFYANLYPNSPFEAKSLLMSAQLSEILSCFRYNISSEDHDDATNVRVANFDVEIDLRIRFLLGLSFNFCRIGWSCDGLNCRGRWFFAIFFLIESFASVLLQPVVLSPYWSV